MFILYDINHNKLQGLINYKEPKLERTLDGEEVLSFLYPQSDSKYDLIQEEGYIRTKDNEYIIKEKNIGDNYTEFICKVNLEDLKGNPISHFETIDKTPEEASNLALVGTGWTIISDVVKRRTVRKSNCSSYDIFQEIRSAYNSDLKFDAVNKIVYIFDERGSDKGAYFIEELNLKELQIQSNSYDFYTRLIPIGKDGLKITEVNGGKEYLVNYQYSSKITTAYWEDNRYTDAQSLKEDGELKLEYISKPARAFSCKILDLIKISDKYKNILDYDLGDTITLISKSKKVKEKQRIVKIIEYLNEPEKNQIEIANKLISLEELQERFINSADTVENITTPSGEILGSKVDGIDWSKLQNVHITIADVQDLSAVVIRVGELEANSATITDLNAISANIDNLNVSKAAVTELTAATGRIATLESDNASINYLLAGNIGAENIKAGAITTGSAIIADGAIGSAQISDLDVTKLNSGVFSTAKFTVLGTNGRLKIENNRLQVFDGITNLYERVALGDIDGDGTKYGFRVRGGDGETVLLDENGVTKEGFTDGYNKVDNGSLNGAKLDIATVVTEINKGTAHITGSQIYLDDKSLNVKISELDTTIDDVAKKIITSNTAPLNPSIGQLWLDTSVTPNLLKKWNGTLWERTGASSLEELDPTASGRLTTAETTISQHSTDILLKVSQTEVDTSINDANAYADALHQEELDLLGDKANKLELDDLTATVTSHTTALSLVDGKISASISSAQASADTANSNLATINTYMDFTEEGLVLGKEGGENDNLKVKITNSEMDFLDNGVKVAYISNQQMEIEKAKILSSIVVGNHLIEKYDSNITLIRWIG